MLGRSRRERKSPENSHHPWSVASLPAPFRARKKSGPSSATANIESGRCLGSGATLFILLFFTFTYRTFPLPITRTAAIVLTANALGSGKPACRYLTDRDTTHRKQNATDRGLRG